MKRPMLLLLVAATAGVWLIEATCEAVPKVRLRRWSTREPIDPSIRSAPNQSRATQSRSSASRSNLYNQSNPPASRRLIFRGGLFAAEQEQNATGRTAQSSRQRQPSQQQQTQQPQASEPRVASRDLPPAPMADDAVAAAPAVKEKGPQPTLADQPEESAPPQLRSILKPAEQAGAVPESVDRSARDVQQGEEEVVQRSRMGIDNVSPQSNGSAPTAS